MPRRYLENHRLFRCYCTVHLMSGVHKWNDMAILVPKLIRSQLPPRLADSDAVANPVPCPLQSLKLLNILIIWCTLTTDYVQCAHFHNGININCVVCAIFEKNGSDLQLLYVLNNPSLSAVRIVKYGHISTSHVYS